MDPHAEGTDRQVITRRAIFSLLAARQARPFAFSFKGYPNWPLEKAFALIQDNQLAAAKRPTPEDSAAVFFQSCLVINENFPTLAPRAYDRLLAGENEPANRPTRPDEPLGDGSLSRSIWLNAVFGLCYCRLDWRDLEKH